MLRLMGLWCGGVEVGGFVGEECLCEFVQMFGCWVGFEGVVDDDVCLLFVEVGWVDGCEGGCDQVGVWGIVDVYYCDVVWYVEVEYVCGVDCGDCGEVGCGVDCVWMIFI